VTWPLLSLFPGRYYICSGDHNRCSVSRVTTRRAQILDAAIAVLGRQGVRGVTHRAVDAAAGVPLGTTSNYFRTRDALLDAVVDRFVERERAAFDDLASAAPPTTPQGLAALLAAFAVTATGPRRELTLARFAILVEAAIRPELQRKLREGAAEVRAWSTEWLRAVGSADPVRDAVFLGNHVEAMTLHQLAYPDPAFDPAPSLTTLVTVLIGAEKRPASAITPAAPTATPPSTASAVAATGPSNGSTPSSDSITTTPASRA
jgi:DNA-binding transcriptional regulator YbjK